jgi:hypothetical protein
VQEAAEEPSLRRRRALELIEPPHHGVDFAGHGVAGRGEGTTQLVPVRRADDEEIDVAFWAVLSRRVRPEEEREVDAADPGEDHAQPLGDTGRPAKDVAHGRHELAALVDRPESKVPEASTLNDPGLEQLLQRALDGMRVGADASRDLPRV